MGSGRAGPVSPIDMVSYVYPCGDEGKQKEDGEECVLKLFKIKPEI